MRVYDAQCMLLLLPAYSVNGVLEYAQPASCSMYTWNTYTYMEYVFDPTITM